MKSAYPPHYSDEVNKGISIEVLGGWERSLPYTFPLLFNNYNACTNS